ncbi:uncharacterized protein KY384_007218 [Bacidia gigantensis]|uniref:uncharacterized protein n=1 Tax=Bacidia gigantensis TaxID=2732470 RepID=UPI001D0493AF|nr:uncharacterized protein KY384_007218 [Bacidia gigantensis]KAG8528301.1 hypothetical protein KY384_007218 [Bacidia gigantensis]
MSDTHSPPRRSATFPTEGDSSPHSPKAISFAAAHTSPSRPTTAVSRLSVDVIGHPRQGSLGVLTRASTEPLSHGDKWADAWTDVHEERLILVQSELKKAQKRWSESQEIWLEEEMQLQSQKRKHQRALKSKEDSARKAAKIWKAKTWKVGSRKPKRKGSASDATGISGGDTPSDDEDGAVLEKTDTSSTLSKAMRRLSLSVRSSRKGSITNTPSASGAVSRDDSPVR